MARSGAAQQDQRAVVARPAQQDAGAQLVRVTREIDNRMAIISTSAAAGIDADRLKLVALTAFTRVPALLACDPVSVARAIVEAGQVGLEPTGLLGGAYLVPRGGQCTLLIGYRGLVMLAMRSGEVARCEARVVREKDQFDYGYGLVPYLDHKPSREADPGPYTYTYAVIVYRSGERQFDVMSQAEVEAIRRRSSSPNAGPWVTDYPEMMKKTVLRRALKLAPLTVNVASTLDRLDPEVDEAPTAVRGDRQAELRQQLQAQLDREYGAPAPTTPAGETAPAQPAAAAEAATPQPPAAAAGDPGPQPDVVQPAAATRPASELQSVAQIVGQQCGVHHAGLGVGPCVLPAGHPENEHEEAGGVRWSQPREVAR